MKKKRKKIFLFINEKDKNIALQSLFEKTKKSSVLILENKKEHVKLLNNIENINFFVFIVSNSFKPSFCNIINDLKKYDILVCSYLEDMLPSTVLYFEGDFRSEVVDSSFSSNTFEFYQRELEKPSGYSSNSIADKFYTPEDLISVLVPNFIIHLKDPSEYEIIDPSAGDGRFEKVLVKYFSDIKMYDLYPSSERVMKQDFLNLKLEKKKKKRIFIGSPPFGTSSSLAISFFNHCAKLEADIIVFILPKSFAHKLVFRNKIDQRYSLFKEVDIPQSFHYEIPGNLDTPEGLNLLTTSFQIWVKKRRQVLVPPEPIGYKMVRPKNNKIWEETATGKISREQPVGNIDVDFTICTHGTRAGKIEDFDPGQKVSVRQFVKVEEDYSIDEIRKKFESTDFSYFTNVSLLNGSQSSISQPEILLCVEGCDYKIEPLYRDISQFYIEPFL